MNNSEIEFLLKLQIKKALNGSQQQEEEKKKNKTKRK